MRDKLKPRSNQRFLKLCNSRVCYSKLQDTCDFPTPQMYSKQAHGAVMSSPWKMNLINQETLVFCQQSRFSFFPSMISCHLLALALWDGITIRLSSVGVSVRHLCQWVVQDGFMIFSEVLNDSTPGIHSWSRVPETPQATVSFKCWLQHMCQLPVYGDRCWNFQMFKCKLQHTNKLLSK